MSTPHWLGLGVDAAGAVRTATTVSQSTQDAFNVAQGVIAVGGTIDVSSLTAVAGLAPEIIQAAATEAYGQMSAGLQAQWDAATTPQANAARVETGVVAATDLISNGYNPDNPGDNQKLIVAIAGGLSLVPAIGPILGGALLALDAGGEAIAKLLEQAGIIWFGCRSSGNWTPQLVLTAGGRAPLMQPGSFSALVAPMIAQDIANANNCKASFGPYAVLTAAATMWNAGATGPSMTVYIPSLTGYGIPFVVPEQRAIAFQPAPSISVLDPAFFPQATYSSETLENGTPPFLLKLNGSSYFPPTAAVSASASAPSGANAASTNTTTTIAVGTAIVAGVGLLSLGAYASSKGTTIGALLKRLIRRR